MSERMIGMASRLYDARRTMKFLHGDQYATRVAELRPYLKGVMQKEGVNEVAAAVRLCEGADGFTALMILAAAVEMVEPSDADMERAGQLTLTES